MPTLAEVHQAAARLFSSGRPDAALSMYDAIVGAAPLAYDARIRVADCLWALGRAQDAIAVYRAAATYCVGSGHPLPAVVCLRVLEAHGHPAHDLLASLLSTYGQGSAKLGRLAARVAAPPPSTPVPAPDLTAHGDAAWTRAAERAATATDSFRDWPAALHPIPLLSELTETAFRRVLATATLQRLPHGALVIREGEPGRAFYFVASGELCVHTTDPAGRSSELARLHENAIFGEMALLSARPRSASVVAVGEVDVLEIGRQSLAAIADEVAAVAHALHAFTRDRLLGNLMAKSPLFAPFDRQQQRDLLRRFTSHDTAPGTVVIREGEPGTGLFVVLTGELEVTRQLADGARQLLATLRSGDVFGEMALLRGGTTSATVVSVTPSTVLFLANEYVERMVAAFPALRKLLEELATDREIDNQLASGIDIDFEEDQRVLV